MQQTHYPTLSIQSRLKRVKLVRMTPERVPAPENESTVTLPFPVQQKPAWHTFLGTPLVKGALGLLIGIGLLVAVSRFVDLPTTMHLMQQRLTTPQGVLFALFASLALVLAFSTRALRWKVLLNPVGKVRALTVLQLFLIGVFLNFLLPIRAGELAKSLVLKRKTGIALSQSLPTITMDKAFDLLPALFVSAVVPLVGAHLDIKLWSVLVLANGCLLGLLLFVLLAAWKRPLAPGLLQRVAGMLPKALGSKWESPSPRRCTSRRQTTAVRTANRPLDHSDQGVSWLEKGQNDVITGSTAHAQHPAHGTTRAAATGSRAQEA